MKIVCGKCKKVYNVDPLKIPKKGLKIPCKTCKNPIHVENKEGVSPAINVKESRINSTFQKEIAGSDGRTFKKILPFEIDGSKKKIVVTVVILTLLLITQIRPLRGIFFENFIFRTADRTAEEYIDRSFNRAMIAYATARGINATISVLQGSNLQFHPAGVGVTIAVGEVLDPVNDIIERFSWIMLVSLLSLGIQKAMVEIGPWLSTCVLLNISLTCLLAALWLKNSLSQSLRAIAKKAFLAALVLKFAMPCVAFLNHQVYRSVLENQYQTSSKILDQEADSLKSIDSEVSSSNYTIEEGNNDIGEEGNNDTGLWSKTIKAIASAKDSLNNVAGIKQKIVELKDRAGEITKNFIRLSIVFILNTIIIPILFLWGLINFGRILIGNSFGVQFEEKITSKIAGKKSPKQMEPTYAGSLAGAESIK